jgi:hypothetical protein
MGSDHERLQARADARLAKEAHRQERHEMNADTRLHGDHAAQAAIEGSAPTGRSGIRGFTFRREAKAAPLPPKPLVRRTLRLRPVDGVTEALAPRKRTAPLPTRTPLDAAAPMHGIAVSGPVKAIALESADRPRGPEAIIRYLRGRGVELSLSTDGAHVVPRSLAGRCSGLTAT